MSSKKIFEWSWKTLSISLIVLVTIILFSPYGATNQYAQKAIIVETEIDAPSNEVFQYLGQSEQARKWSTFVRSIKTINDVADGSVGSKRRCFGKEDGVVWDEEIVANEKNEKRRLSVFNTNGFPLEVDHLFTEQLYEAIPRNKTRLKLSLFLIEGKRNLISDLKMYIGGYFVADIFQGNLANIKKYVEEEQS